MTRGVATRFAKGHSGNPRGRPRKVLPGVSAFDIIIEKTLTVTQNGVPRELSVDEALQLRTYQDALGGSRSARRAVLKMIAKREKWIADNSKAPHRAPIEVVKEHDPDNADAALLLLGIACKDDRDDWAGSEDERLLLEPWAVEAALQRSRKRRFEDKDLSEMRRCTRDADSIAWP